MHGSSQKSHPHCVARIRHTFPKLRCFGSTVDTRSCVSLRRVWKVTPTSPLYLAFLFGVVVSPDVQKCGLFDRVLPEKVSVFCGSTADTVHTSVPGGLRTIYVVFYVKVDLGSWCSHEEIWTFYEPCLHRLLGRWIFSTCWWP